MSSPKLPANQTDALPVLTPDQTAAQGVVTIVGTTYTVYWSNGVLGSPQFVVIPGTKSVLLTNYIDGRGCRRFVLVVKRSWVASDGNDIFGVFLLPRFSDGSAPVAGDFNPNSNPGPWFNLANVDFSAGGFPNPYVFSVAFALPSAYVSDTTAPSAIPYGSWVGSNFCIAFRSFQTGNNVRTWELDLWGSA